jgi:hypothetical protein
MADQATKKTNADPAPQNIPLDDPLPSPDDPGGAHAKGYSADPQPEATKVPDKGLVPLAPGHDGESAVRQPERDGKVRPTGRSEEHGYSPNDRLMGSDR